ncbi:MAG: hypothetical protein ABIS13_00110 [Nitrosospira sp.]
MAALLYPELIRAGKRIGVLSLAQVPVVEVSLRLTGGKAHCIGCCG